MRKSLGIGVIGAGFIGRVHTQAARLAEANVVGVFDRSVESAGKLAAEQDVEQVFESAEALICSPEVDVVHICVPNHLHVALVEQALAAGKHVVCEKPLATTLADAARVVDLLAQTGLTGAVPFAYRYLPMAAEARHRVRNGEVGDIRLIGGSYLQDWLFSAEQGNWRVDEEMSGRSRAFADIGSHLCDLLEWLSGQRITSVIADIETVVPTRPVAGARTFEEAGAAGAGAPARMAVHTEDVACVLVRMSEGALGTLTVSQVSGGRKNALRIALDGSSSSLVFDSATPDRLWLGRPAASTELDRDPAFLSPAARRLSQVPAGHAVGFLDLFVSLFKDVYAAVRGVGSGGFPEFGDGLRAVQLTEAVLASAEQRAWVKVGQ